MSDLNIIQRASGATSTADLRNMAGRLKRSQLSDLNATQRRTGATSPADLRRLANR